MNARRTLCYLLFSMLLNLAMNGFAYSQQAVWPDPIYHRYIEVEGNKIFYRESGNPNKPTILFLHGYPSSSHMYRHLIPLLSGRFHVIAPDNIGSGYSDKPDPSNVTYTFDYLARVMEEFVRAKGLEKYSIYMQDFGAPVGLRLMMAQPERVERLITQNGNVYLEGLTPKRQDFFKKAFEDRSKDMQEKLFALTSKESIIKTQYLRDVEGKEEVMSPDSWTHDGTFLQSIAQRKIQVQLFQDYYTNLQAYPRWQEFLRKQSLPTLIVWGENDPAFITAGGRAFLKDIPHAQFYTIDAGHFAMEEKPVELAKLIIGFMNQYIDKQFVIK
ncbi:alpha/beta hydrolase [Alteromonas sp. KUL17]|uniref:alpha/beta fold hydrolase n=1 Tax=Alteromonas sp. KUL17 TaxID=2480796 RepID=UPI0010370516|nr:alpha/beta hydrolase [Alteromonas sp. KUL17]TAP29829.1 alpha/beta hydrolase [Alteromonas sp. KUL17]GEA02231.1 alpha/beta hydrolase [Alteromonas sp. KUL17]